MMTPEQQTFISGLRFRMAPGHENPPTLDEQRLAIKILRDNRSAAAAANAASAAKKPRAPSRTPISQASVSDALADLDSM
jgi:outer membrane protein assembly factor BamE (lipoprotein component of BamABCDE complex)